jgi:hypothetical protein
VGVQIFSDEYPGLGVHVPGNRMPYLQDYTVHPMDGLTVCSGPAPVVHGLSHAHSRSFWTVTTWQDRAAVTLHWVLSDRDYVLLRGLLAPDRPALSLAQLVARLEGSAPGFEGLGKLKALLRPIIREVRHDPGAGTLVVRGSGFTGALAVAVEGMVMPIPAAGGDGEILLPLGEPRRGAPLMVSTPLGESDPFPYAPAAH